MKIKKKSKIFTAIYRFMKLSLYYLNLSFNEKIIGDTTTLHDQNINFKVVVNLEK